MLSLVFCELFAGTSKTLRCGQVSLSFSCFSFFLPCLIQLYLLHFLSQKREMVFGTPSPEISGPENGFRLVTDTSPVILESSYWRCCSQLLFLQQCFLEVQPRKLPSLISNLFGLEDLLLIRCAHVVVNAKDSLIFIASIVL